jgi:hypothetical protein
MIIKGGLFGGDKEVGGGRKMRQIGCEQYRSTLEADRM